MKGVYYLYFFDLHNQYKEHYYMIIKAEIFEEAIHLPSTTQIWYCSKDLICYNTKICPL